MRANIILSRDELQIFINQLQHKIEVDYPLTNQQILTADPEDKHYELDLHISSDDFGSFSGSEIWDQEKPNYNDFVHSFLASNLITYPNLDDFRELVNGNRKSRRKYVYAPDTNLFYNRFISTGEIKPDELLIVNSVHKEITRMLNKKYSSNQISEMRREIRYQKNVLDKFSNQRMKKSRKARNLALQEYLQYADKSYATIQTKDLVDDKEENDMIFVESIREYQNKGNTRPVILTCDKSLTDLCVSLGVDYFFFEFPRTIQPINPSPSQLCQLLCNLAAVLGVIKINNTLLYSEFIGKQDISQYQLTYLSGKVPEKFARDLEICQGLVKLMIKI